ncbi:MAG: cytochrome C [Sulfurospirillaceae bacterium]|jgi:hypothetical protein|nr:cytochrome C [Sulfurospirillaceae bacterium]MDD2827255.1 cytochrome C [Sulfurospirillaceae bacterium]
MNRLFSQVSISLLVLGVIATFSLASEGRGQRMFDQNLKKACGINGLQVARAHTQAEWTKIYESNALNNEMRVFCPEAKDFKETYQKDVYEFMYALASDSGKIVAG